MTAGWRVGGLAARGRCVVAKRDADGLVVTVVSDTPAESLAAVVKELDAAAVAPAPLEPAIVPPADPLYLSQ